MKKNLNISYLNGAGIGKKVINIVETINNQDKVIDITENGSVEVVADKDYTGLGKVTVNVEVASSSGWTGHADVEGLKAIGWDDEDIAYYQANGVNWNEEDDQYHKVPEDNIALYGVLAANNISDYKNRIVYLPKIDTSGISDMSNMFADCYSLVFIPQLDTANVTTMSSMFANCHSLISIPKLNTTNVTAMNSMFSYCHCLTSIPLLDTAYVTTMNGMFGSCYALITIPQLNTSNVTNMQSMLNSCYNLTSIPQLDTTNVTDMGYMFLNCRSLTSIPQLNTTNVTNMRSMVENCYSLITLPQLDAGNVTNMVYMFNKCYSLQTIGIKKLRKKVSINYTNFLTKDSLLYLINNGLEEHITITLSSYCYTKYAEDVDVVEALNNHPTISIAS